MPIYTLTLEKYRELLDKKTDKENELNIVISTKPIDMYMKDLKELKQKIKKSFR